MSAPWESDPVVEDKPRAATGLRGRSAAPAAWEADAPTPTVESALPDVSGNQGGLAPPGRRVEIPGVDPQWAAGQAPAQVQAEQRRRVAAANPVRDKVVGAVEGALDIFAKVAGGTVGGLIGLTGAAGGGPGEAGMQVGAEKGIGLVRDIYQATGITTGPEPQTEFGRTLTEGFDQAAQNAPPVIGVHGSLAGAATPSGLGMRQSAALATEPARRGLEAPIKAIAQAVERALPSEAPPAGSVGAAGTKVATQRRERAASLPVPVKLTKGDAERTFEQQRFEKETAKNPELGKPLREAAADKTEAVTKNFEAFIEQTGATEIDRGALGRKVVDPIVEKAEKAKQEIRAAYEAADAAGETSELVPYSAVRSYIEDQTQTTREKLAPILKLAEEQLLKNDPEATGQVSIKALEDVRKAIRANTEFGTPNSVHAGELIKRIDAATENAGGDLYKGARKLYAEYAKEFKEKGVIRDLIQLKKNSSDRRTAFEDVFDRAVLRGSLADVQNVRDTLIGAGEKGAQAWKDMRGTAIDHIRKQVFGGDARDERGNKVPSSAKFGRVVDKLDEDGKLDFLFGKKGAEQMRDLRDVVADINTAPPGSVNTSNTASVLVQGFDTLATYMASGGTVPLPAFTLLKKGIQNLKERKIKAKVRYALGPDQKLEPGTVRAFEAEAMQPAPRVPEPAPTVSREASARPGDLDTRLAEIDRLKEGASPETVRVLEQQAKKVQADARAAEAQRKRAAEAEALEKTAQATEEPELRQALQARANELRAEKIPAGEATELASIPVEKPEVPKRGSIPVGRAEELPAGRRGATKRERELVQLREQATDTQVLKDLDTEIAAERKRATDAARGAEYLKLADAVTDPEIKAKFEARAAKLGAERKAIPAPEVRELALDPMVDAVRMRAEGETAWRKAHRLGDQEAARAKTTWQALEYDSAAVERAAQQFENSPGAFDREVRRIIEEGKARETQGKQGAVGSEDLGRRAEATRLETGSGGKQSGPDRNAAPRAEREGPARPRGATGAVGKSLADAEEGLRRATEPTGNPITDRLSAKLRKDYDAAVAEYAKRPDSNGGTVLNTDTARELSPDYLKDRTRSADVHEPASAFIKKVYADRLAGPTPAGKDRAVLFTAGGTGAGKSTGLKTAGGKLGNPEIVFDTNMNGLDSSIKKIEQALDAGRDVRILYTYADPVDAFYQAMSRAMNMARKEGSGRTVPLAEHVKTHVGASEVMRALTKRYRNDLRVDFQGVDNSRGKGNARPEAIDLLPAVKYNLLREQIEGALNDAHQRGEITDAIRAGFLAESSRASIRDEGVGRGLLHRPERASEEVGQSGAQAEGLSHAAGAPDLGATGAQTSVVTERGLRVPVQYRLADVGLLITSHDDDLNPNPAFNQDIQPRDRSRMSSQAQITRIQNDIQPELLADSPKASDGAPIIGPDGIVESGNARTIALRRAYQGGKADRYRAYLEENAERFGLTAADVRSMDRPVLVRERTVDVDRADFARQANESAVSAMSDTEQARADAQRLPDLEGLITSDDGQMNTGGSAEFIRQFMRYAVSPAEQGQLMTADGRLSQRGANRIRNAIFSKAYDDPNIVALMAESTDANVRNILGGMLRAAPEVAKLRNLLDAGTRAGRDFAPDLVEAVRRYSDAREQGMKVNEALSQGSLLGGEASEPVVALMRSLEADARAPKRIADMIRGLVDEIDKKGDPNQAGLF
jgi:hypothetical protein